MVILQYILILSGCAWSSFYLLGNNIFNFGEGKLIGFSSSLINSNPFYSLAEKLGFGNKFFNTFNTYVGFIGSITGKINQQLNKLSLAVKVIFPNLTISPLLALMALACCFGFVVVIYKFVIRSISILD